MKITEKRRRENVLLREHELEYVKSRILHCYRSCSDDLLMGDFSEMKEYLKTFESAKEDFYTNIGYVSVNAQMNFRPFKRMVSFLNNLY